jgi:hypothetical protein
MVQIMTTNIRGSFDYTTFHGTVPRQAVRELLPHLLLEFGFSLSRVGKCSSFTFSSQES